MSESTSRRTVITTIAGGVAATTALAASGASATPATTAVASPGAARSTIQPLPDRIVRVDDDGGTIPLPEAINRLANLPEHVIRAHKDGSMTLEVAQPTFDAVSRANKLVAGCELREVLSDWLVDHTLDHGVEPQYVNLTRAAFKQLARNNDVDWHEPGDFGVRATFQGVPIRVPGSKLDVSHAASPVAGRISVPFRVAAVPAGAFVLDVDDDDTYVDRFVEHAIDESLDGRGVDIVYMTRAAYKTAVRDNMIDYIPDESGHITVPVFLGRRISVIVG